MPNQGSQTLLQKFEQNSFDAVVRINSGDTKKQQRLTGKKQWNFARLANGGMIQAQADAPQRGVVNNLELEAFVLGSVVTSSPET